MGKAKAFIKNFALFEYYSFYDLINYCVFVKLRLLFVKYLAFSVKLTLKFNFMLVILLKSCTFAMSKRINLVLEVFL